MILMLLVPGIPARTFHLKYARERTSPRWLAFIELLDHPWFDRAWVVQEAALVSRTTVIYGDMRIPWEILITAMNVFGSPEMGLLVTSTEDTAIKRNTQQDIDMR